MVNEQAGLLEALSRLDKDVAEAEVNFAEAEKRLARLRMMRDNIQPFIEQYVTTTIRIFGGDGRAGQDALQEGEPAGGLSFTDAVVEVLQQNPEGTYDVDEVVDLLRENGSHLDRVRVRNSLNYAVRLKKIHRGSKRGTYTLRDTSTPDAPGVEVNEESDSEGSSREEGDRGNGSIPLRDQGGGAHAAQLHLGRAGDRASIGG